MKSKCKEDHCMQTACKLRRSSLHLVSSSRSYIISLWNLFWVMTIFIWMQQDQLPKIRFPKTLNYLNTTTCIILLTAAWQSINDIQNSIEYLRTSSLSQWMKCSCSQLGDATIIQSFHTAWKIPEWQMIFVNSSNSPFFQLLIIETLLAGLPLRGAGSGISPDYYECGPQLLS